MANKGNKATEAAVGMSRGTKILIAAMVVVMVAAISVAVWAIFFREDTVITPDYAPPEKEEHAEKIEGDDDTKLDVEEGGGGISINVAKNVTVDLSDKVAYLYYANPGKSTQDVVVQVVVHDTVIVQSGRLEPGNQVRKLDLLSGAEKLLTEGGYDGKIVVLAYNPDTGEKSIINTELPLTVNVQK